MAFNALAALFGATQGLNSLNRGQRENQDLQLAMEQQQAQSQRQAMLDALTQKRVDISQGHLDLAEDKFATGQRQQNFAGEQDLLASMLSTEGDQLFKNALSRGDFGSATRLSPTLGGAEFATRKRLAANEPPKPDFSPPQARTAARAEKSLDALPIREELRGTRSGLKTATRNLTFADRFDFSEEEIARQRADSSGFANQIPILEALLQRMLSDSSITERSNVIQGGQPIQGQVPNASPQAQDMAFEMMTHSQAFDIAKRDITDWETLPFQIQQQVIEKIRIKGGI